MELSPVQFASWHRFQLPATVQLPTCPLFPSRPTHAH